MDTIKKQVNFIMQIKIAPIGENAISPIKIETHNQDRQIKNKTFNKIIPE